MMAGERADELRLAAHVDDLTRWIARARPGSICVYARGAPLDPESAVGKHARVLAHAGAVGLRYRKAGGVGEYLAVKLAAGHLAEPLPRASVGKPVVPDPETNIGGVYALLAHAARYKQPCPTNREIALALALPSVGVARHLVAKLKAAGLISVVNRGARLTRIVTIAANGARTSASRVAVGKGFERAGEGA